MSSRSINLLRLFARRAIALESLAGWPLSYRDPRPSSFLQVYAADFEQRRWLTKEAQQREEDGPRYRNRTKAYKKDRKVVAAGKEEEGQIDEPPTMMISFNSEELVPGRKMLERIVKELEAKGMTFILPTDDEAIEEIIEPFRRLQSLGAKPEFINMICINNPKLFILLATNSSVTLPSLSHLVEVCAMSYEEALSLIASFPEIITTSQLTPVLDCLVANGVPTGRRLASLIKKCPALIFARPPVEIQQAIQGLAEFFSRKQIANIIHRCTDVLLKNVQETQEKYEYIFYQMGLEGEHFIDSARWGSLSLNDIIQRHEFLVKCGRFRTPDPKRPQYNRENPSLRSILDTSDEHFAVQIAQVTHEEWIIYREICDREADVSTREHPFVRVKPSMRKAYERRRKEAIEQPEYILDSASSI